MQCHRRTDTTHACPVVGRRDLLRRQRIHNAKLQAAVAAVDMSPPRPQPHLTVYGRDHVTRKKATTEAAFSDLKMLQAVVRTLSRRPTSPERSPGPASLNVGARRQEALRIMRENRRLLDRLECAQPTLATSALLGSRDQQRRHVINASHAARLSGEYDRELAVLRRAEALRQAATRGLRRAGSAPSLRSTQATNLSTVAESAAEYVSASAPATPAVRHFLVSSDGQ